MTSVTGLLVVSSNVFSSAMSMKPTSKAISRFKRTVLFCLFCEYVTCALSKYTRSFVISRTIILGGGKIGVPGLGAILCVGVGRERMPGNGLNKAPAV